MMSVYVDRDDNVWTGTYYSGPYISGRCRIPFSEVAHDKMIQLPKAMINDAMGDLWILTDNFGLFHSSSSGNWKRIPGTEGIKYQCAYYDSKSSVIWTSDYYGRVFRYSIPSGKARCFHVQVPGHPDEYVASIVSDGHELYLGGVSGIYVFNPESEDCVTRQIPGYDMTCTDLAFAPDGTLWVAGKGLYTYNPQDSNPSCHPAMESSISPSYSVNHISFDRQGRLWACCIGHGIALIDGDDTRMFSYATSALADNYASFISPFGNSKAIVGTAVGLSIIDAEKDIVYNFGPSNGLMAQSRHWSCSCPQKDGSILICGDKEMERFDPAIFNSEPPRLEVFIDRMEVNGKPLRKAIDAIKRVDLKHDQSNFSVQLASFDYMESAARKVFFKLEGMDDDWVLYDGHSPAVYTNVKPGHYKFRAKAILGGMDFEQRDINIVLHPAWYATLGAKAAFILILLLTVATILYGIYRRALLTEQLSARERESEEKTRLSIEMSYQLRGPVNLIIGQLEAFFRNWGTRTAGIADLEDIYSKAKHLRAMISDYVDKKNDEIQESESSLQVKAAAEDAKFLNAAIGAVERNLYSDKLDISILCRELNVGKTTLTLRLKKICGMTPREFIEDIRLRNAAQMLVDGSLRISEVSERLGYCTPAYFSSRFKAKFGCLPSEYKQDSQA